MRALEFLVFHTHSSQHIVYTVVNFLLVLPSGRMEYKLQILVDVTVVKQLEVLKYNAHITTQSRNVLTLQRCQVSTEHIGSLGIVLVDIHLAI